MANIEREIANFNGILVWTRYTAMLLANSVALGFINSSASNKAIKPYGCIFGIFLTIIWWQLTTISWSLMHAWLEFVTENGKPTHNAYKIWMEACGLKTDPIWLYAHLLIALFYFSYMVLFAYYWAQQSWVNFEIYYKYSLFAVIFFCLFIFKFLILSSYRRFSLKRKYQI